MCGKRDPFKRVGIFVWIVNVSLYFNVSSSLSPLWDSVKTSIVQEYDVIEGNDLLTVRVNMGEHTSTDLVVGEDLRPDSRVTLTCIAHHGPAEWVYSGDGTPNFVKNSTTENISANKGKQAYGDDMNGAKRYVATLTLGYNTEMTTDDSGRYNCMTASPGSGLKYKTLSAFYHIYVPAKDRLFIRKSETVSYDLNNSAARIPCGVTNPKASVSLQKFVQGELEFVPSGTMLYHPISGFYPKKDIKGTYVCTAGFNGTFDFVHFTLVPVTASSEVTTFLKNVKHNIRKSTKKPIKYQNPKPEDLEWLLYPNLPRTTTPPSTRKPTIVKPYSKVTIKTPYIPFHLRYTTTPYPPFQTFFDVETVTTKSSPLSQSQRTKVTTSKSKFDPSKYPNILLKETTHSKGNIVRYTTSKGSHPTKPITVSSSSSTNTIKDKLNIPQELISYRPIHSYTKGSSSSSKPKFKERPTPSTPAPSSTTRRTTPRRYRPKTTTTPLPETLICSGFKCGENAECFANAVYNESVGKEVTEPGCRCVPPNLGNPYLLCHPPDKMMDTDVLFFNLTNFRRIPVLAEPIYSDSESASWENGNGESGEGVDRDDGLNDYKKTLVDIIDM